MADGGCSGRFPVVPSQLRQQLCHRSKLVRNILIISKLEVPIKQIRSSNKQRRLRDKPFILESFGLTTSLGFQLLRDLFHRCGTNELFMIAQRCSDFSSLLVCGPEL